MDGRSAVEIPDWDLAGTVISSSVAIRQQMLTYRAQAQHDQLVTQGTAQATREMAAEDVKERQKVARLAVSIEKRLKAVGKPIGLAALKKATTSGDTRKRFPDALERAIDGGHVQVDSEHAWYVWSTKLSTGWRGGRWGGRGGSFLGWKLPPLPTKKGGHTRVRYLVFFNISGPRLNK